MEEASSLVMVATTTMSKKKSGINQSSFREEKKEPERDTTTVAKWTNGRANERTNDARSTTVVYTYYVVQYNGLPLYVFRKSINPYKQEYSTATTVSEQFLTKPQRQVSFCEIPLYYCCTSYYNYS